MSSRRLILTAAISPLAGAVIAYVVGLACAIWGPESPHMQIQRRPLTGGANQAWYLGGENWCNARYDISLTQDQVHLNAPLSPPPRWIHEPVTKGHQMSANDVIAYASGWPLKGNRGAYYFTRENVRSRLNQSNSVYIVPERIATLIESTKSGPMYAVDPLILPLGPFNRDFLLNTLIFAAPVATLLAVNPLGLIKRRHRLKRGLCPNCAYDVQHADLCPECGWRRTAQSSAPKTT